MLAEIAGNEEVTKLCVATLFDDGQYIEVSADAIESFTDPELVGERYYDLTIVDETMYIDPSIAHMFIDTDKFPF